MSKPNAELFSESGKSLHLHSALTVSHLYSGAQESIPRGPASRSSKHTTTEQVQVYSSTVTHSCLLCARAMSGAQSITNSWVSGRQLSTMIMTHWLGCSALGVPCCWTCVGRNA